MGFFDSLTGAQKTTIPASGYYSTPPGYQSLYAGLLGQAQNTILPGGQLNSQMFTPLPQTQDETNAFNQARQGLAPTQESLQKDVQMQMNPFDDYVINDINRQSQGQNSLVNQAATQAGQQGSNRSFLGSSDVEQNRLNSIGQFRQGQYNTAVNNALGPIANLRQQDIQNQLGIGSFQRGLDSATNQAPFAALQAGQDVLNGFPTKFGNFGSPQTTIKTGGGLGGLLSGPLGQLGLAALTGGGSAVFGGSGLLGANQALGALGSSSGMGPYQGFFG